MELSSGKCTLCEIEQKVFNINTESFTEQIQYAFFAKNKEDSLQEFSTKLALCIICSQKLQISFDFKKSYDEMCNRNNKTHKKKCFFCESKTPILLNIDNIMMDYDNKIKVFLNSVIVYHSYEGLSTCIKCIYNLNIWWETRTGIYLLMNLPKSIPASKTAKENYKYNTPIIKRSPRQDVLSKYSSRYKLRRSILRERSKKLKWKMYLNKRLGHVRTANEIIKSDNLSFEDVDEIFSRKQDDKLFNKKVYVSISINSQISQSVLQNANIFETITINDSDDSGISSPANENSRISRTPHAKTPFKLKFSSSFSKLLVLRTKHNYTCNVCDKVFLLRCDYLSHLLKHEKMESVIINVTRYNLPDRIKVSEFENLHRKKSNMPLPAKDINQLLVKWVGEHAADTFNNESRKENGKNVNNTEKDTDVLNDVTEIVEENCDHEEENITNGNVKSDNSMINILMTEKDTGQSNELIKNTVDSKNYSSKQINENCQIEVANTHKSEETEEKLSEATTCNKNNETDRDEKLELTPNIDGNGVTHKPGETEKKLNEVTTCNKSNETDKNVTEKLKLIPNIDGNGVTDTENENNKGDKENQNKVEVEGSANRRNSISEITQNISDNVVQNVPQDERVTQKDELNSTSDKTNTSENTSETPRKSTCLSLRKPESAGCSANLKFKLYGEFSSKLSSTTLNNTKIVSCEELLSILESDDCNIEDKIAQKLIQLNDYNAKNKTTEKSTQLVGNDDYNAKDKMKGKSTQLKDDDDHNAKVGTIEKPTQLKGNDDCNAENEIKEKSTQLKDDDQNAEVKTIEKFTQLEGDGDHNTEDKTTEKSTLSAGEGCLSKNDNNVENISSDEVDENIDSRSNKRKRTEQESDETPKRKRVRFANEKVIMTPDNSILLEKVSEGNEIIVDD